MTNSLMTIEKDYVSKMTDEERQLYFAGSEQLTKLRGLFNPTINYFVDISQLLNALDANHQRYNDLVDKYVKFSDETADIDVLLDDTFNVLIAVGQRSMILPLSNMDHCQALYEYLAQLKIVQFELVLDEFKAEQLLKQI